MEKPRVKKGRAVCIKCKDKLNLFNKKKIKQKK